MNEIIFLMPNQSKELPLLYADAGILVIFSNPHFKKTEILQTHIGAIKSFYKR